MADYRQDNIRLRSQLDAANEEIKRLRFRLETAGNVSHLAGFALENFKGMHQ